MSLQEENDNHQDTELKDDNLRSAEDTNNREVESKKVKGDKGVVLLVDQTKSVIYMFY